MVKGILKDTMQTLQRKTYKAKADPIHPDIVRIPPHWPTTAAKCRAGERPVEMHSLLDSFRCRRHFTKSFWTCCKGLDSGDAAADGCLEAV